MASERTDSERLAVIETIVVRIESAITNHIAEDKALADRVAKLEQDRAYKAGAIAIVGGVIAIVEPIVFVIIQKLFKQ